MNRDVLVEILARAMEDEAFRTQLLNAPEDALEGYAITAQERHAFATGSLRELLFAAQGATRELD
jgi:hypothetical protein